MIFLVGSVFTGPQLFNLVCFFSVQFQHVPFHLEQIIAVKFRTDWCLRGSGLVRSVSIHFIQLRMFSVQFRSIWIKSVQLRPVKFSLFLFSINLAESARCRSWPVFLVCAVVQKHPALWAQSVSLLAICKLQILLLTKNYACEYLLRSPSYHHISTTLALVGGAS